MRWKADLPKMPRLPKVRLEPGDPAAGALGPPPAPSAYREKNPSDSQPAEYKPRSMLAEHRALALFFLAAAVGFVLYCWRAPRRPTRPDAPPAHAAAQTPASTDAQSPIYVETVPDKDR